MRRSLSGPPHGFGIGNPRKYVDVDSQLYSNDISQKTSRALRLPKFFIFFKKTTSVAGTFKKDQVQKFCSSQKLEYPQVENFESKKVGNFPKNPEIFQSKINENRFSRFSRFSIHIDFPLKIFRILTDLFALENFNLRML